MPDFSLLESFFDTKDIRVIEGEFNTKTAQGRFLFRTFCNMAVWYFENLSEEVRTKMQHCVTKGYYPSVSYFGYRKGRKPNDETGEKGDSDPYLKHPDHNAKHVRYIYELYDTGKDAPEGKGEHSFRSIAKHLNEKKIRNAKGGKFTKRGWWSAFYRTNFMLAGSTGAKRTGRDAPYCGRKESMSRSSPHPSLNGSRQSGRAAPRARAAMAGRFIPACSIAVAAGRSIRKQPRAGMGRGTLTSVVPILNAVLPPFGRVTLRIWSWTPCAAIRSSLSFLRSTNRPWAT